MFNPANVAKSQAFFDKHGSKTIVLARFVPVVRTFTPVLAGVGKMHYRTFVTYNVIGGVLWGAGITTLGYFLGNIEFIKNNLEIAAIIIVADLGAADVHRVPAPPPRRARARSKQRNRSSPSTETKSISCSTGPTSSGRRSA